MLDTLMHHAVLASLLLALAGLVLHERVRSKRPYEVRPKLPALPIVGAREGEWLPTLRAMWRNSTDIRAAVAAGYRFTEACLFPVIDLGTAVVLPPAEVAWFLEQPETKLSAHYHQLDAFQFDYTLTDPQLVRDVKPLHKTLINTKLTREINNLLPLLADEVARSVSEVWRTDTDSFRDLCPMDVLPHVISRVVNRAFVGAPTCYSRALVDNGIAFAQTLGYTSIALRFTPQTLRPVFAPLMTLPGKRATRRFFAALRPEVDRRLHEMRTDAGAASKYNDFLQWTIDAAMDSGDEYQARPRTIMGRVLILNFVSIHTSTFALSHVLFDLAAHSPAYIDELRAEIVGALEAHGGHWTKQTLADMPKLDSAFRESQRMNPVSTMASPMPVTDPNGITTPSGLHLRYGTYVAVLAYPILHDPNLYPDPETFRPFRFADRRETASQQGLKMESARQAWTSVSTTYPAFGMGRHACPGRFFASSSLKITLAYLLMNYDFEKLPERPPSPTIGFSLLPPLKASIRFKRREKPLYVLDKGQD
ncbi:Uncharacterized protein TCAP_02273 [Tolypocladium capitatum]|uniref:Ent-kaurene oxidase n=1 Tax=Tolypocladium capitatum TaxID=45235 RepID=A0A2K3QJS7_9HYPO|nr:Uncharacterized protein TCAP_02273 [Tolypocladium capitatum]